MILDIEQLFGYHACGDQALGYSDVQTVSIDEDIRVGAAFDSRKVRPMWFRWRNRYFRVKTVNYAWSSSRGSARLRHYSVTDGKNTYELRFDTSTLEWSLGRVSAE